MMRSALAVLLLCTSTPLAGCATPQTAANATTLDERAGIVAETMYAAASRVGANLVAAGRLDAARYHELDTTAYNALLVTRAAYKAGNAASYAEAAAQANAAASAILNLTGAK